MEKREIINLLSEHQESDVERYASYIIRLLLEKRKDGTLKNYWIQKKTALDVANLYKRVASGGQVIDGVHITIQSTGISFDYIAYKNKMYKIYPETLLDLQLVYEGEPFEASKKDGKVFYTHIIQKPFCRSDDKIVGGYCVIKNNRGEFLTILNKAEFDKHRKIAKGDFIWRSWLREMCLKTIIKKAVKYHFDDEFQEIEAIDNENYELRNPLDLDIETKQAIDTIEGVEALEAYYLKNKGRGKAFDQYVVIRKGQLLDVGGKGEMPTLKAKVITSKKVLTDKSLQLLLGYVQAGKGVSVKEKLKGYIITPSQQKVIDEAFKAQVDKVFND